jgi:hypothetical protein
MNKKIVIIGGGTISHVRAHLAICAPAYGKTARTLEWMCQEVFNEVVSDASPKEYEKQTDSIMDVWCHKTVMAGGPTIAQVMKEAKAAGVEDWTKFEPRKLETNEDVSNLVDDLIKDDTTKIIFMSAAMCDWNGWVGPNLETGKYAPRLKTKEGYQVLMQMTPADKVINKIRQKRKDIFLVGFKTTTGATEDEQYIAGLDLCKKASCNLVLANDIVTRVNMVVTPEEARYHVTTDREAALRGLVEMAKLRSHLSFTRSTVIEGKPIAWDDSLVPPSLRKIVNWLIKQGAYKPFNGATAGHFAVKLSDNEFLTSIRKTNFNRLPEIGLVKVVTDGPDTVLAYGAKPSVGGQSQRIVFKDHPGYDCIVHFHCPIRPESQVPTVSQREYECGSHECGQNTSRGLKKFGNLSAVYLDQHGPNIVFNNRIEPEEVIKFIEENFDLNQKTGGFVSLRERLETPDTLDNAVNLLKESHD